MIRESVWDYPRPAICQAFQGSLKVIHGGEVLAHTAAAYRTLETSHPPTYYFPPGDIAMQRLSPNGNRSFCEWKGEASYFDLQFEDKLIRNVAWAYNAPSSSFRRIRGYLSFYASKVDACFVNDERAEPQEGDFYGGWITANIAGPFKGAHGTGGW